MLKKTKKNIKNSPKMQRIYKKLKKLEQELNLSKGEKDEKITKNINLTDEKQMNVISKKIDSIIKTYTDRKNKIAEQIVKAENIDDILWQAVGEAMVGMAHHKGTDVVPCQDAYCLNNTKRLIIVVCDGAGSAILSDIGSKNLSQSIARLVLSLENFFIDLLDECLDIILNDMIADIIYKYSILLLKDLGSNHKRNSKDFRTTLLLFVAGGKKAFWLKVGDGEIVIEKKTKLVRVGTSIKGEYSNETVFIDEGLKFADVQYGLLDISDVTGIAVMTDGTSERLVSIDGKNIAGRLSEYFDKLRNCKLPREELYKFLTNYEDWKGSTHDDKAIVLASR
ncbi:MAG: protein phosphatase 2C domain-containing protein [Fusobacteriaceae bacterium]|jgi:hypothetical protein|nr:protein phosphatase 2C domain-containing protein [Fusobacteriaceae bacterium]